MKMVEIFKKWNEKKGTCHRCMANDKVTALGEIIEKMISNYGEEEVTKYFEFMLGQSEKDLWKVSTDLMFNTWRNTVVATKIEQGNKEPEEKKDEPSMLTALTTELMSFMGKDLANKVSNEVENKINQFIEGKVVKKVVDYKEVKREVNGIAHEKFDTILKFVSMDEPVMLVGPAGTGKNVLAKQVADALGLEFYFTSAVTQEYKLTGYGDANGEYVKTQFYDAFTKGGVFLFDEVDASVPEAMVVVNSAIANRYFDFPVMGRQNAHPDFRVIACANTYGTGASLEYVGRNQLDGATLNRFGMVEVDYDRRIENGVCPNLDIAEFCRSFRDICNKNGVHHIVSYREMSRMYKMIEIAKLDAIEGIKTCLTKGLENDTLTMICNEMPDSLLYKSYFKKMINSNR